MLQVEHLMAWHMLMLQARSVWSVVTGQSCQGAV